MKKNFNLSSLQALTSADFPLSHTAFTLLQHITDVYNGADFGFITCSPTDPSDMTLTQGKLILSFWGLITPQSLADALSELVQKRVIVDCDMGGRVYGLAVSNGQPNLIMEWQYTFTFNPAAIFEATLSLN